MSNDNSNLAPMLERRRIEAEILGCVHAVVKDSQGVEAADRVVAEAVRRSAVAQGRAMAAMQGGKGGIQSFVDLQPLWTKGGALEVRA